jgi:uncharacterized protein involved in outer membrane biogenesis
MANATPDSSQPAQRRSWGRRLLILSAALLVVLVILYFVATSAVFFKGVILPRVSQALSAEITVGDASISPFSQVVLRQLTVKTSGVEPLLLANEVRLRYSLRSILGGNIKVDEVTLDSPAIQIVQNADGTSNLDPLLKTEAKPAAQPPAGSSKPLQLDVRNVALKNVKLRAVQIFRDGARQTIELSDVNIGLDQLKNGAAGKLTLAAAMKMDRAQTNAHDSLQARGAGGLDFALGPDLIPEFVRGKVTHQIENGSGLFSELTGERTELNCDVTPTEVKTLSVAFFKADKPLGALRVSGPFDLKKLEGRLSLEVQSIDRQVLNLAGAARGWDFGSSTLNATNLIDISQKASVIAANGKLIGRQLGIRQGNQSTPPLDLDFEYQVTVNLNDHAVLVQRLNLGVRQGQVDLLRALLDKPMNLSWGQNQPGFKESSLQLVVNKLNLADWQLVLGNLPVNGKVDAQLNLVAQQDGKQLKADLTTKIQELSAQYGSNKIERANIQLQVAGQLADFKNATVEKYSFDFGQDSQSLLTANGSAGYGLISGDLSAQTTLEASLPGLLKVAAIPQLSASAGTIKLTALAMRKGQETNASGNLVLGDFSGRLGDYQFKSYQATFDFDVGVKDQVAQLRRLALAVRQGIESGGSFDVAGKYDTARQSGEFSFSAVDFNQNAVRPFLAPALAPNKLVSLSLNAKGSASYNAQGDSSVKAELKLANFVVEDSVSKLPKPPLSANVQLDALMQKELVSLRQFLLTLATADRAKNELQASGKFDLGKKIGEVNFSATDFREAAFQPFLAPALAPNKLVSVSLNAKGNASYNAQAQSSIQCDLSVTNLVVEDPDHKLPKAPQSLALRVDGAMQKELVNLRQVLLTLAPTDRAKNKLELSGKIDLAKTNAAPGQLSLQAESLDITPYYDLFAGKPAATTPAAAPQKPTVPAPQPAAHQPTSPPTEPEPVSLPFKQFTFDAKIGQFYLRELAVANLVTTAKIDNSRLVLKPFQLTLNGAPMSANADLNLGVKGWTYDLALNADKIPLDPFVNSFMPDSRGQYHGLILANAQIKGAGITDASLQKNLSGQLGFSFTNASIQLFANNKPPKSVFGRLIWYPLEAIGVFLRINEVANSPLNAISVQAQIGDGKVNLSRVSLQSQAFEARTQGVVPMQVPLTNSPLNLPLEFSLSRSLAEKSGLMPANTPPNAVYAPLPTFVAVKGTVGAPKSDFKELAVGGLLLKTGVGVAEQLGVNVGGKTGGILKGVGNLLTGQGTASTNVAETNKAGTNAPPRGSLLDQLLKKK